MKQKKSLMLVVFLIILSLAVVGCSNEDAPTSHENQAEEMAIIASTSWTALIAEAATGQKVSIMAPVELRHPPEYDFKPSDIVAVQEADWVVMAGYEGFMRNILESNSINEDKVIQVRTTNTYEHLVAETQLVAEKLGTEEMQQNWENEFTEVMNKIMEKAEENDVSNTRVLVHTHMADFTRSLGFDVIEVFGAEELSPAKIGELANLNPDIIIDNYHNPQGIGIAELSGAARFELRNFPGPDHTSIIDLIVDNAQTLGIY